MGSVSVSSCRCCMFVSCVHPVAVLNAAFCMTCSVIPSSSSSCHQTSVFHLSTHFFAVSLNLLRSSNEQDCTRRVHCIMCAVFSVARPHS